MSAGLVVVIGSGETGPSMVATHRSILDRTGADRVTLLDSSYGFQTNAAELTEKISEFFASSLGVDVEVASLQAPQATTFEQEAMVAAVKRSRVVFAGPGSPSYALRLWEQTELRLALAEVVGRGGAVVMASAAALTLGFKTIPVYEIYKVGADPYWLDGLDLLGAWGFHVVIVPHWNNREGGTHDTSHCFIGTDRFERLANELGAEVSILGVDEHTAVTIDLEASSMTVSGVGSAVFNDRQIPGTAPINPAVRSTQKLEEAPSRVPPSEVELVLSQILDADSAGQRPLLRSMIVDLGESIRIGRFGSPTVETKLIELAVEVRERARRSSDFELADLIRSQLAELGVEVRDQPGGPLWDRN